MRFDDFARRSIDASQCRDSTRERAHSLVRHAFGVIGSRPVARVTRADLDAVLVHARDVLGLSAKTRKNLAGKLRHLLRQAGSEAAEGLRVDAPQAEVRALSGEEAERLRVALDEGYLDRAAQAVLVLLDTGLRLGEVRALRDRDWVPARRVLLIVVTKNGRRREVDVPDRLVPILDKAFAEVPMPFRLAPQAIRRRLWRACRAAALPLIRLHDLRHTRATHLLLAGVPPLYVSQQLGHHSPSYTMAVYGHLTVAGPAERRGWANRV